MQLRRRGLELVVLGSGGPRSAGRAASSYLLTLDGTPRILVDVGPGMFVRLGETGLADERLDTVLLTHLHIDHAGDLAALIKSRDLLGEGPVAMRIFGPSDGGPYPDTETFVARLFGDDGAFAYLPGFRNELQLTPSTLDMKLADAPRVVLEKDGARVTTVAVDHGNVPALAYRVDYGEQSVVISGDLASRNTRIAELSRGADLLVYDAAVLDPPGSPAGLYELHTPPRRIGELARDAGVGSVLLSHIPPVVDARADEVVASVEASYAGPVHMARDCMHVALADLSER